MGFTKGDLQAAFERAHAGRTAPKGDSGDGGPAPADPEKLDQAREARDEYLKRQPRREDRERDRER